MRRRTAAADGTIPDRLLAFVEADWPADDVYAAYGLWREARDAWAEAHGWPGGETARWTAENEVLVSLPDAPFDYGAI